MSIVKVEHQEKSVKSPDLYDFSRDYFDESMNVDHTSSQQWVKT
jgi:hypothetical protein